MLNISITLKYPILNLMSIGKKSFENLGCVICKSGKAISRLLRPASTSLKYAQYLCQSVFHDKKKLYCVIDDTLIKKMYAQNMQGSGMFFDGVSGKQIMAYRLVACLLSDGKIAIPIECSYLFAKELLDLIPEKFQSKEDIAKTFISLAAELFSREKIIVVADGFYATKNILRWCVENGISAEMRMHSNRVVNFKGKRTSLKNFLTMKGIQPKGRQMARTISVFWHEMPLEITIVRRIDKHGVESTVFQVATYKALPRDHVSTYKKRWVIEKMFRTTKQHLGLQDCFSKSLETQHNHVASVFLSYVLAQLDMRKHRFKTPEEAIRRFRRKNANAVFRQLGVLDQSYEHAHT